MDLGGVKSETVVIGEVVRNEKREREEEGETVTINNLFTFT